MQPSTMLAKLSDNTQTILFSEGDGICSTEVFSSDVVVTTNAGTHNHGSSKVKLKSLVDYNWECKYYAGQLLALHMSGKYLAYSIKAPNSMNPGSWSGMVRVVYSADGSDRRALIKGMKGEVHDLSFAHIEDQVILACIDEQGNFFVHEIELSDSGLRCTLVVEVREEPATVAAAGGVRRVLWCPYIPDEDDSPDEDVARLLLTTHCSTARMWNMRQVTALAADSGSRVLEATSALASGGGVTAGDEHSAPVVDAAFSPDGSALATAALDGYVMFFQVYMHNEATPRCLHKWQPHGGKPLSSLLFLDNHKKYNSDVQFWKFAVTGAENNKILKVWSCKTWTCLQTITFTPGLGSETSSFGLKAMLDTSANYLLLSDSKARSLYVMHMARDDEDTMAYCKSISEFLLPYPVLSFCIVDAGEEVVKCESSCDDPYHRNGSAGDTDASPAPFDMHTEAGGGAEAGEGTDVGCARGAGRVRVRLYIVQPKGLQQGELAFEPPPPPDPPLHGLAELTLGEEAVDSAGLASSILQQQSQQLKNLLMRTQPTGGALPSRLESPPGAPLTLMTPDAFSSPGKHDAIAERRTGFPTEPEVCDAKLTSVGSSPSREVQQIMSLTDQPDYYKTDEGSQSPVPEELPVVVQNGGDALYTNNEVYPSPEKPSSHTKITHTNSEWPQISIAQITEANQRKASSDKSSVPSLTSLNVSGECEPRTTEPEDKGLEQLQQKIDQLTELVRQQSRELATLRSEMTPPRALLEQALAAHSQHTAAAIDTALTQGWERVQALGEAAGGRAATAAGRGAARALEPLAAALQHELAAKLTATDRLLHENIAKLATSKTVLDRLSGAIATSLTEAVRTSFREALLGHVVPQLERAHQQLFQQINLAFQSGTREFIGEAQRAAGAAAERGGAAALGPLRAALDRHATALAQQQDVAAVVKDTMHTVLEKELCRWRSQLVAEMSRAHSPATPATDLVDRQMQVSQVQSLINAGDYNGAFQLALSASDLALVMAACRAADPAHVPRLKQHVLLSLVQQLSADMAQHTQLKHRYLEEAVMCLDTKSPVTREHLPTVVRELQKQIVSFLAGSPAHPLARPFKMLLMATEALLKGV